MTAAQLRNLTHQEVMKHAFFEAKTPLEKRLMQLVEELEDEVYSLTSELEDMKDGW
jgi:hypothetical protein